MDAAVDKDAQGAEKAASMKSARDRKRVLDTLPTGARLTGEQAAARSTMIRRLRIALPVIALALVATFLLNTQNGGVDQAFLEDFQDVEAQPENLSMGNPRFTGVDAKGNPFDITAIEAIRNPDQEDYVTLDRPRAVTSDDGKQSVVFADKGGYATEARVLELEDNVTLDHSIGGEKYVLTTPAAKVNVENQLVTSDSGVYGSGPKGTKIKADRMNAFNQEGRIIFEGNVSMRIYPSSQDIPSTGPLLRDGENSSSGDSE